MDTARGLSVEARARTLAAHGDGGLPEWGASATCGSNPGAAGRVLALSLAPCVGAARWAAPSGCGRRATRRAGRATASRPARARAESAYGLERSAARPMTPFLGPVSGAGGPELRTGVRFARGSGG